MKSLKVADDYSKFSFSFFFRTFLDEGLPKNLPLLSILVFPLPQGGELLLLDQLPSASEIFLRSTAIFFDFHCIIFLIHLS